MSSTLIVEVCAVDEVKKHPNADKVELVRCKNWWSVAPIGCYKVGDKVVYVPPDCVIPEALAERWGIAKYCPPLPRQIDGARTPGCRIKAQRFRGEQSFGTVQRPDESWPVGTSVVEHYGITKYEPPVRATDGDAASPVNAFHGYTSIENINNFPGVFMPGEEVVISEKIHGTNCRVGYVLHPDETTGEAVWKWMAGSHNTRRKEYNQKGVRSLYWFPFQSLDPDSCKMRELIRTVVKEEGAKTSVIVFGEIFGAGVQDMQYGQQGVAFRAFDIAVDGKYLDFDKMAEYTDGRVDTVPYLWRGPFSLEKVAEFTDGLTTLCDPEAAGKFKGREGVVVRPVKERYSPNLPNFGRVILKSVSVDYYGRKGGTEYH